MGWGWAVPISGKHPNLAALIGQFYQTLWPGSQTLGQG
jgi:hypothetical protein